MAVKEQVAPLCSVEVPRIGTRVEQGAPKSMIGARMSWADASEDVEDSDHAVYPPLIVVKDKVDTAAGDNATYPPIATAIGKKAKKPRKPG